VCAKAPPTPRASESAAAMAYFILIILLVEAIHFVDATISGALEMLIAFAVVTAALAVIGFFGLILIEAGQHPALTFGILGIFGIDRAREHGIADRDRCCGRL